MSSDGEEGWSSDPETNGSQLMRQPSKPPPVDELVLVSPSVDTRSVFVFPLLFFHPFPLPFFLLSQGNTVRMRFHTHPDTPDDATPATRVCAPGVTHNQHSYVGIPR